jgi:hypothetical protein
MTISLIGMGSESLMAELDAAGVECSHRGPPVNVPMNSGDSIEIATGIKDAVPWAAIASVLVTWLRSRASRKVILTLEDNTVLHAEGMSIDEIKSLLRQTRRVSALETKKPEVESK